MGVVGAKAILSPTAELCGEVLSLWVWVSMRADGAGAGRAAFSGGAEVEGELGAASKPLHQPMHPSSSGGHSALRCPTVALW